MQEVTLNEVDSTETEEHITTHSQLVMRMHLSSH